MREVSTRRKIDMWKDANMSQHLLAPLIEESVD